MTINPLALAIAALFLTLAACEKPAPSAKSQGPETQPQMPKEEWHFATGAIDGDCGHSGQNPDGGVQFMVPCPASSTSPDGKWKLVLGKEGPNEGDGAPVTLEKPDGSHFASVPELSDTMPFVLYWSPRPNWFLVNHHVGSFMDAPEVYEITATGVEKRGRFTREALKQARRISPCLPVLKWDWSTGWATGWSRDGRRVAWVFSTRNDACVGLDHTGPIPKDKVPKTFWMISNVDSGMIVPGSVRIVTDDGLGQLPKDDLYSEFR